jgi:hypothetical protein
MRTLKCKRIAPNISLYVAGDLVGEAEREVAVHLVTCEDCRRLSEEFSESSSMLARACSAPEFGAEFYSGIRSAVLSDIGRSQLRPSLFRPRWLYATAFAAVLIISGMMFQYLSSARRQPGQIVALVPQVTSQPIPVRTKETAVHSSQKSRLLSVPVRKPDALDTAQAAGNNRAQIAQEIKPTASAGQVAIEATPVSVASASAASSVSRIEIQTTNPNIRIIWLTPRETQESEDADRDQDQQTNGIRK